MKQTSLREQWLQTKMGHPVKETVQEAPKPTESVTPEPEPVQEAPKPRRGRKKKIVLDDDDD